MAENTPETETTEFKPVHKGAGRYEVAGKRFDDKASAQEYADELNRVSATHAERNAISDLVPADFKIDPRILKFRDNLRELPLNETHYPDGTLNPMYDREYEYIWASYTDRTDVPDKMAEGFELVSLELIEEKIESGKLPEHYRHLLRPEGRYLVYGDDVLLRIPRVLQRQRKAAKRERALAAHKLLHERTMDEFDNANIPIRYPNDMSAGQANELSIKF